MSLERKVNHFVDDLMAGRVLVSDYDRLESICREITPKGLIPLPGSDFSHFASLCNFIRGGTIVDSAEDGYSFWLERLEMAEENLKDSEASLQDLLIILLTYRVGNGPIEFKAPMLNLFEKKGRFTKKIFRTVVLDNMYTKVDRKVMVSFGLRNGYLNIEDVIEDISSEIIWTLDKQVLDKLRLQLAVYRQTNPRTDGSLSTLGGILTHVRLVKYPDSRWVF